MMYPFMTLPDDTEIVHSEVKADGRVKVYIETPDEKDGFHHASCYLPDYEWTEIDGYSEEEPLEPIHVHIAEGRPQADGTKVWLILNTDRSKTSLAV